MGEVERQVNSLKRQASKAERYRELSGQLRASEQELVVLRSGDLRGKLKELEAKLGQGRDRLAALTADRDSKAARQQQARDREMELSDRLSEESQQLFDFKSQLTGCEHQVTRLTDQLGVNASRVERIQREMKELEDRAGELGLRMEEAQERLTSAEAARTSHQQRYEELARSYSELEESGRASAQKIELFGTRANDLRQEVARAENEVRMAEALIARREEERAEIESTLNLLREGLGRHEARKDELTGRTTALATAIETLQRELEATRAERAKLQEQLADRLRQIEQTRRSMHEGRSRLATLNELRTSYEGYYQGVREVMVAADGGRLRGLLGVAPNLIRAKKEHEVAIEVALATHLQDIVTRTAEDAKQAIEYLKSSGRGRATFLPLDRLEVTSLRPQLVQSVLGRPGVLGIASRLVDFDPQISTAVEFLLGSTIVVQDLDVGLRLGREGNRARYVSLDGQLINPSGAMTGGRIQATGLMSREREIRDLTQSVEQLEARDRELTSEIEKTQTALTATHAKAEAQGSDLDVKRLEQAALLKDLESAEREYAQAASALGERDQQVQQIDADVATRRQTIEQWQGRRGEQFALLEQAEAELAAERESARNQGENIISLGTEVAEARAEVEKARERMAEAERQRLAHQGDLEAIGRQRTGRQTEIESIAKEDALLREQIERIKNETQDIAAQCESISVKLTEDQTNRDQLQMEIRQLNEEVERLTRDERQLDNQLREDEIASDGDGRPHGRPERAVHGEIRRRPGRGWPRKPARASATPHALQVEVGEMRERLERMGLVNMAALEEYEQQKERLDFLTAQNKDLTEARAQLSDAIARLDETTRKLFHETFEAVRGHFIEMFRRLFGGGKSDLILDAPEGVDPLLDGGIEIFAQPPGKKLQNITLMSGGEKALTAIAMLFGLFLCKPSPFCIMDEIDAPLDDNNIERFKTVLNEFKKTTQFLVITHNKLTMELADGIYGVTMEESGVSKLVSVRFEQAEALVDAV